MKRISIILVFVLLLSVFSVNASAATLDTWGPQSYTPYTAEMGAFSWGVAIINSHWSSSQVSTWSLAQQGSTFFLSTEYEFRPGTTPISLWYEPSSSDFSCNFPGAYYEFEETSSGDDVSVCSSWAAGYDSTTSYYGVIWLDPQPGANFTNRAVTLESEYGMYFAGDSLPLRYEVVPGPNYFGNYYDW